MTVGPAKVKACKTILFTGGIPEVEVRKKYGTLSINVLMFQKFQLEADMSAFKGQLFY